MEEPPVRRANARRRAPLAGVVVVALVATALVVSNRGDNRYPKEWDARIAPLARYVEAERGLTFRHPVYVDFLDDTAFEQGVVDDEPLTDDEQKEFDRSTGLLRAVGLLNGEVDLASEANGLSREGTLALYRYDTKRITVRGLELDAARSVTVVHELTHALQDQYFDLERVEATLDVTQSQTFRAVVEGDASRIEDRYFADLPDDEQAIVVKSEQSGTGEADLDRFPSVLVSSFAAPYALGQPFVDVLDAFGGPDAIDEAITSPPRSLEQIMDPFAYLDGDEPVTMSEPALDAGDEAFDRGDFGALDWYLVLHDRVGPQAALAAVDGWEGDAYVAFNRKGTVCVRAVIRAESPDARDRFAAALTTWVAAMPAGVASIRVDGDIDFESCDPGASFEPAPPVSGQLEPLTLPSLRSSLAAAAGGAGQKRQAAECFSRTVAGAITVEQMLADTDRDGAIAQLYDTAAVRCGFTR